MAQKVQFPGTTPPRSDSESDSGSGFDDDFTQAVKAETERSVRTHETGESSQQTVASSSSDSDSDGSNATSQSDSESSIEDSSPSASAVANAAATGWDHRLQRWGGRVEGTTVLVRHPDCLDQGYTCDPYMLKAKLVYSACTIDESGKFSFGMAEGCIPEHLPIKIVDILDENMVATWREGLAIGKCVVVNRSWCTASSPLSRLSPSLSSLPSSPYAVREGPCTLFPAATSSCSPPCRRRCFCHRHW